MTPAKMRICYLSLNSLIIISGAIALIAAILGEQRLAIAMLAIALMILPPLTHIRMRRMLASIKCLVAVSVDPNQKAHLQPIEGISKKVDRIDSVVVRLEEIVTRTPAIHSTESRYPVDVDVVRLANEIRRDVRTVRLVAEELLSHSNEARATNL